VLDPRGIFVGKTLINAEVDGICQLRVLHNMNGSASTLIERSADSRRVTRIKRLVFPAVCQSCCWKWQGGAGPSHFEKSGEFHAPTMSPNDWSVRQARTEVVLVKSGCARTCIAMGQRVGGGGGGTRTPAPSWGVLAPPLQRGSVSVEVKRVTLYGRSVHTQRMARSTSWRVSRPAAFVCVLCISAD
jgi:hypothetical protein